MTSTAKTTAQRLAASAKRGVMLQMTGRPFDFDATDNPICLRTIGHALALTNRFGGHTQLPYSVAQHSVEVCDRAPPHLRAHALLHDAHEAFIGDLIRPLHDDLADTVSGFTEAWGLLKRAIDVQIRTGCGLPELSDNQAAEIHEIDLRMLATEQRDLFDISPVWKRGWARPYETPIRPMPWERAEDEFWKRVRFYLPEVAYRYDEEAAA